MNLAIVVLLVVAKACWPGGFIGFLLGLKNRRALAGAFYGFAGGVLGAVLGAALGILLWQVFPKRMEQGLWLGIASADEVRLLSSAAALGSGSLGCLMALREFKLGRDRETMNRIVLPFAILLVAFVVANFLDSTGTISACCVAAAAIFALVRWINQRGLPEPADQNGPIASEDRKPIKPRYPYWGIMSCVAAAALGVVIYSIILPAILDFKGPRTDTHGVDHFADFLAILYFGAVAALIALSAVILGIVVCASDS